MRASSPRGATTASARSVLLAFFLLLGSGIVRAQAPVPGELAEFSRSLEQMIAQVSPAIVQVFVTGFAARGVAPSTGDLLSRERGTGSGVILDPEGYIVTNAHVVVGARRVQVLVAQTEAEEAGRRSILKGGGELAGAQIIGVDLETDLAVLRVQKQGLPVLRLADSDQVKKGQLVFAFGSPFGLGNSVTMGVVSSVARQLREDDPMIYIQTDAPINPGNSGGPLVNAAGEVVGISTSILSLSGGSEGVGFAAPSNIVKNVFAQIRAGGVVHRGAIGVNPQTITPAMATALRLPRTWGVILGDVLPGSPAEKAGLRIGDVVLSLDGKPMENGRQLDVNLYGKPVGKTVSLEILRGGDTRSVSVEVIQRPERRPELMPLVSPEKNLVGKLGILALDLGPDVAKALPKLRRNAGVVVAGRAADAPFWETGLLPGDVIYAVNGTNVRNLDELRRELEKLAVYAPVVLQIERDSQLQFVAFELE
jgi:serine protease Do